MKYKIIIPVLALLLLVGIGLGYFFGIRKSGDGGIANGNGPATGNRGQGQVNINGGGKPVLYHQSHALVIGMSKYRAGWEELNSIPEELNRLKPALETHGFQVQLKLDLDGETLRKTVRDYISGQGIHQDNRLLLYFAGHGHSRKNGTKGYFVPVDAPLPEQDEGGFVNKALSMEQVLTWAREIESKHALFMFDSCFSGTIFKVRSHQERPNIINILTDEPARQFITAGKADEVVPAKSVFTPAFIDAITKGWGDLDNDGYVTGTELGLYLRGKIPDYSQQTPQFGMIQDYELSRGDFVFELHRGGEKSGPELVETQTDPSGREKPVTPPVTPPPPPVVEVPPEPPVGEQDKGYLQVATNVKSDIWLDGQSAGSTSADKPLTRKDLSPGTVQVTAKAEGYQSRTESVQITKGKWRQLIWVLEPKVQRVGFTIESNVAQAVVYINNERKGTPGTKWQLVPGAYNIRLESEGYEVFEKRVNLQAGSDRVLKAAMTELSTPPRIVSFKAYPPQAAMGQAVRIRWSTLYGEQVTIDGKAVKHSGAMVVSPSADTSYHLEVKNKNSVARQTLQVRVDPRAAQPTAIDSFTASKSFVQQGETTVLHWRTRHARRVALNGKSMRPSGSLSVKPARNTGYTLQVWDAAGKSRSKRLLISVVQKKKFNLPREGVNTSRQNKIGPYVTGKTVTVRLADGRPIGYINIRTGGRAPLPLARGYTPLMEFNVSAVSNLDDANSRMISRKIRSHTGRRQKETVVVAGALRFKFEMAALDSKRINNRNYYRIGREGIRVDVEPVTPLLSIKPLIRHSTILNR